MQGSNTISSAHTLKRKNDMQDLDLLLDISRQLEDMIIDNLEDSELDFVNFGYIMQLQRERELAIRREIPKEQILEIILRIRKQYHLLK
jgi:hypothetical protein